jgi:hypothetical protein
VTSGTTHTQKEQTMFTNGGLAVTASDVARQKSRALDGVAPDRTIGELVEEFLRELDLPTQDPSGHPLVYHARLEREGRHLNSSELVGDALATGDRLVLQPLIQAG